VRGCEVLFRRALSGDVGEFPGRSILEQAGDQSGVHGVTGAFGYHVALDAAAGEREVADEVEHFVANVLVGKAKGAVFRAAGSENDGVLRAGAANEAHVAQALFVGFVAEGTRRSDSGAVGIGGQIDAGLLAADGSGKVDGVANFVTGARVDGDELVAFADFDGAQHADGFAAAALGADAGIEEGSRLSISTITLSTPVPMSAESRCSVVEMSTPWRMRLVA
jgi:hypothetical protein